MEKIGFTPNRLGNVGRRSAFSAGIPLHRQGGHTVDATDARAHRYFREAGDDLSRFNYDMDRVRAGLAIEKNRGTTYMRPGGERLPKRNQQQDVQQEMPPTGKPLHRRTFAIQLPNHKPTREAVSEIASAIRNPLRFNGGLPSGKVSLQNFPRQSP